MKIHTQIVLALVLLVIVAACSTANTLPPVSTGKIAGGQGNANCICTQEYAPVCGVDKKTYSNACMATCAGVETTPSSCE